jgi:hypothetical protein
MLAAYEKWYVRTSNRRPSSSVGRTVTVEPSKVTNRKWNTRSIEPGLGAEPHALPWVLDEYDHPIAY